MEQDDNGDDLITEESIQSFDLENINSLAVSEQEFIYACSSIKNTFDSLNNNIKIIQKFNNLSVFDTNENCQRFIEGKVALENLMQSNEWKSAQNTFQNIQLYKKPSTKSRVSNTTSELISLSPSKKQKRHESYHTS